IAVHIDARDAITFALKCFGARFSGIERNLAFGGPSAHQDSYVLIVSRHSAAMRLASASPGCIPMRLISHSSSIPLLARTRSLTSSPSVSTSAALALASLIRKLQCISDIWTPPTRRPRHPAASINFQALCPGGFLKVEPPVRLLIG